MDVTLQWSPNSESDLAGYRLFYREESQSYDYSNPSWEGTNTTCTIYNLDETKSYYFIARAYDTEGFESGDSNEVLLEAVLSDLEGTVWFIGTPCAPGLPCQVPSGDGPDPNYEIIVYKADGVTIETQAYSDANGDYRVGLSPEDCIIYTPNGPFGQQVNAVTIVNGETTTLNLVIDTGIRSDYRLPVYSFFSRLF